MDKRGRTLEQAQTVDASALAKTVETSDSRPDATTPVAVAPVAEGPVPVPSDPGVRRPGVPTHIGRYVILRTLGEGGMGVVYAAYDEELDRKVAVKLIHPSLQGNSQIRTRILREAQALARVSAPNVVTVYQVGEVDGQLFIAMEFVNGTTLAKWQTETRRPWPEILRIPDPLPPPRREDATSGAA
ncbi:MAG: protein kinase [Polyangia bacterium]